MLGGTNCTNRIVSKYCIVLIVLCCHLWSKSHDLLGVPCASLVDSVSWDVLWFNFWSVDQTPSQDHILTDVSNCSLFLEIFSCSFVLCLSSSIFHQQCGLVCMCCQPPEHCKDFDTSNCMAWIDAPLNFTSSSFFIIFVWQCLLKCCLSLGFEFDSVHSFYVVLSAHDNLMRLYCFPSIIIWCDVCWGPHLYLLIMHSLWSWCSVIFIMSNITVLFVQFAFSVLSESRPNRWIAGVLV